MHMAMKGGIVIIRVQNPSIMHSEHSVSIMIIMVMVKPGDIPSIDGYMPTSSWKLYICRTPNCISIRPTNSLRNRRPRLVYEYPVDQM